MRCLIFFHSLVPFLVLLLSQTGCSIFFGSVKPIVEKSTSYEILDLSAENPEWEKISKKDGEPGVSDLAFQSKITKSIISLNSTCKADSEEQKIKSLRELTRELLRGFHSSPGGQSSVSVPNEQDRKEEKSLTLNNIPALQTTLKSQLKGDDIQIQTIVLRNKSCVYDLMYIAKQNFFETHQKDFDRFSASLKLK